MIFFNSSRLVAMCMLALVSCLLVQLGSHSSAVDQKQESKMIHYSDIPDKVQIVGKLGQPLGQLVTVRGTWKAPFPSKPASSAFIVNQVNGRQLDPPAEFDEVDPVSEEDVQFAKKALEQKWELRGVETGAIVGFSDKVWEELGQAPIQRPPRGFLTRFCYVKAKRVSRSEPTNTEKE